MSLYQQLQTAKSEEDVKWLKFVQNAQGAILSPLDSFLVMRGTKTLAVRMPRHEENARAVAHFLRGESKVKKVFWPGFETHPNHDIARRQMRMFGGMVSFLGILFVGYVYALKKRAFDWKS